MISAVSNQSTHASAQVRNVSGNPPKCLGRKWAKMEESSAPRLALQDDILSSSDSEVRTLALRSCSSQGETTG